MPVYEYRCDECGRRFERLAFSMAAAQRPAPCPDCGAGAARVPSSFGMSGVEHQTSSGSCSGCSKGSCAGCGH